MGDGFAKWSISALLHRVFHGTPIVICYERSFHTERKAQWYRRLYRRAVLRWWNPAMACNGSLSAAYADSGWACPAERIILGHMVRNSQVCRRQWRPYRFVVAAVGNVSLRSQWLAGGYSAAVGALRDGTVLGGVLRHPLA